MFNYLPEMFCNYEDGEMFNDKKIIISEKEMEASNEEGEYAYNEYYMTKDGEANTKGTMEVSKSYLRNSKTTCYGWSNVNNSLARKMGCASAKGSKGWVSMCI